MDLVFIDTNILVYALDKDAGAKHQKAKAVLHPYFHGNRRAVISLQVMQEYGNRLYRWGWSDERVAMMLDPLRFWRIVRNDLALFEEGLRLKQRFQLAYWDSFILAAATAAGAATLLTEDFNQGQHYGIVKAVNPLA